MRKTLLYGAIRQINGVEVIDHDTLDADFEAAKCRAKFDPEPPVVRMARFRLVEAYDMGPLQSRIKDANNY